MMEDAQNKLVSVVMPMYNCADYVAQSIESVLAQSYENWELLIVDDHSSDASLSIAMEYAQREPRIRVMQNECNGGAAVARNYALREARGRWVAFLDSDDLWLPQKLEKQLAFMQAGGYHFSYTQYETMNEDGSPTGVMWTGPRRVGKARMFAYDYLGCLTVMYDREYIGLVQIPPLKKRNDYALWLKVVRHCPCYLLEEPLAQYRVRGSGSISDRKAGPQRLIRFYYEMYRRSEEMGTLRALFHTGVNLVCGVLKKVFFKRKVLQ